MFDEHDIVLSSCKNIKEQLQDTHITIVKSNNDESNESLIQACDDFVLLPNLGKSYNRFELPSQCICRNFSEGFSRVYKNCKDIDLIVALTGDTLITDAKNFLRRYEEMKSSNKVALVSQAIGQDFHRCDCDPANGISGGRYQSDNTTDFACCLFLLNGEWASKNKAFQDIKITNKYTSEQCLGDELLRHTNNFYSQVGRLNKGTYCYEYDDGIRYHAKYGGPSRPN